MIFDDNGKIDKIVPVVRNDAAKLIEECMLAANVCAAEFSLVKQTYGFVPVITWARLLKNWPPYASSFGLLGLSLGGGDNPTPKDLCYACRAI